MGCGASVETKSSAIVAEPSVRKPSIVNEPSVKTPVELSKNQSNRPKMTSETVDMNQPMRIVISAHSSHRQIAENLRNLFLNQKFLTFNIDETSPKNLSARANLIRWCDIFVVFVARCYHRTFNCMEALNYAKDVRRPILSLLVEPNFRAYGALGAIAASSISSFVIDDEHQLANIETQMINSILSRAKDRKPARNVKEPSEIPDDDVTIQFARGNQKSTVLICAVADGLPIGQLVRNDLSSNSISIALEDLTKVSSSCSIESCSVFVPIITTSFEENSLCLSVFQAARQAKKPIVPVLAVEKWRPNDWLGLAIAGLTFFRIPDQETAYKKFFDSNRMTDLKVEIQRSLQKIPDEAQREQIESEMLKKQIEEIRNQLKNWPPPRKNRRVDPAVDRQPVRVTIEEPSATHRFAHIHHSITRLEFTPPTPLLDEFGLPKRREIDCMISYQWDDQNFVRKIYEDMSMREFRTWFDIWGAMQGNTNDAMALGVECAKVLLVFLSKAYLKSDNCLLEFRYAMKRGKAFVIIRTQPNLTIEPWMAAAIQGFPQYDVSNYQQLEELVKNVPRIDVILQSVRKLANVQPPDPIDDCSYELGELRSLLDDSRDALLAEQNKQRFKKCGRCRQDFDEFNPQGCKNHRSYYLGGSIIEGRWVCCRQQDKDSLGCQSCDHTEKEFILKRDPNYGTWTWVEK